MTEKSLAPEVIKILDVASKMYGSYTSDQFNMELWGRSIEVDSPIEQMFLIAFQYVNKSQHFEFGGGAPITIEIKPQMEIGNYRVDFYVTRVNWPEQKILGKAVVECDGHAFHDRDERQRRYEKIRDRFLQKQGYRIFHFTGSEIKQDPFKCAAEVYAFIGNANEEELIEEINNVRGSL